MGAGAICRVLTVMALLPTIVDLIIGQHNSRSSVGSPRLRAGHLALPFFITVYLGTRFLERDIFLLLLIGFGGVIVSTFAYHLYQRLGSSIKDS